MHPGTKPVLIRLPSPLYDYLAEMFGREGPHFSTANKTDKGILVNAKDVHGVLRQYNMVRTTQFRERPVKNATE